MRKIATLFLLLFSTAVAAQKSYNNFQIKAMGKGVWTALQKDPYGHSICNAGIIDLGDQVLVFDPFMNPDAALELKKAVFQLTRKPVKWVVNSHFHNDHIRGNQVFETATIISSNKTKELIQKKEPVELAWEQKNATSILKNMQSTYAALPPNNTSELPYWIGYFDGMVKNMSQIKTVLPSFVFNDSLEIQGKNFKVILKTYSKGHTESDVTLLIPELKIAFMGDLLFVERFPSLSDGNPLVLHQILESFLTKQPYELLVPGHGPVGTKQQLAALINYLNDLKTTVKDLKQKKLPDSSIMQQPPGKSFTQWKLSRFHTQNLELYCNNPEYYQ